MYILAAIKAKSEIKCPPSIYDRQQANLSKSLSEMTSPMNVYNIDGFPSVANALLWGTTLTPLNQSTATVGYVPQVVTGGGLTLTPASGLGITWANVLAAGNTSGANNPTISSPQYITYAALGIGIGMNGDTKSVAAGEISIGGLTTSGGTNATVVGRSAASTGASGVAVGFSALCPGSSGVAAGVSSATASPSDIAIGNAAVDVGTGQQGRISIGQSSTAGTASVSYSIAMGSSASSTGDRSIAIGRLATSANIQGVAIGPSCTTGGTNDIAIGSVNTCVSGGGAHSRICIGTSSTAGASGNTYGISIGSQSVGSGAASIAIGRVATATHTNAVAIGISATTTANNQIMLGNNATGGLTQVRSDVGIGGEHVSAGFFRSVALVRAEINATGAAQTLAAAAAETVVQFPAVSYSEDHEAPNIQSVANQLQQRQNYSMTGIVQLELVFAGAGPAAAVEMTVRIKRDIGGVKVSVAKETYTIPAGLLAKSLTLAYTSYVPSGADGFMECTIDNPSSVNMSIGASSHFVGAYLN